MNALIRDPKRLLEKVRSIEIVPEANVDQVENKFIGSEADISSP